MPTLAFILGNNKHGKFSIQLNNTSDATIFISVFPAGERGIENESKVVNPKEVVSLTIESNNALKIFNPSEKQISVKLKVNGDKGLTMGVKSLEN